MIDYEKLSDEIINYRRDLHRIPELGFFVYKTNSYIREVLSSLSCKVDSIVKTGITAYFDFGMKQTLVFRSDMDALPIQENTDVSFISTHEGCMHACGHDGHMAILLGFAKLINSYQISGKCLPYNVLLLFQPAEETIGGAINICKTDIFERFNCKAIFGLHLWPFLSFGEITTRPGPMMAKSTAVAIDIEGVSAHCGEPEKGKDALASACDFIENIYRYKELNILERSILKFGKMSSGDVRNAISSHTRIDGTMRTFKESTWTNLVSAMEHLGGLIEEDYGVKFTLDVSKSHPAVINDETLYLKVKKSLLHNHLNFVEMRRPVMIAEDFSFFEEKLPGVFFFLGTGSKIPLHNDRYTMDDSVLIHGVRLFETLINET